MFRGRSWRTASLPWGVLLAAALATPAVGSASALPRPEAPVGGGIPDREKEKADVLLQLTRFVAWPQSSFAAPDSPFVIGVLGDARLGDALRRELAGRRAGHRALRVDNFATLDEVAPCPVLWIAAEKVDLMSELEELLDGAAVLTVGDREDFLARGGILRLVETRERLTFDIDLGAARNAGLQVTARLLGVARRIVSPHPDPPP